MTRSSTFPLTHYARGTFAFVSIGENAGGVAGAIVTADPGEPAGSVRLDFHDRDGLGTVTRG
jgi:hypothetical protein